MFPYFTEENCIPLQYTGWGDIYEGDIVAYDHTDIGGGSGVAEVMWMDDFCLQSNPGWCLWKNGYMRDSLLGAKVIGNIYQNPELLEVSETFKEPRAKE
jgi:hypothetical protein